MRRNIRHHLKEDSSLPTCDSNNLFERKGYAIILLSLIFLALVTDMCIYMDFPVVQMVKNLPAMQETWLRSLGWADPLEKGMATHSRILAQKSHGQGVLEGCSPWDHKELDMTE